MTSSQHVYEVRPRSDKRGVDLRCAAIRSPVVGRAGCDQQCNRLRKVFQRSHDAVIRVYDGAGKVMETHGQTGDFKEW